MVTFKSNRNLILHGAFLRDTCSLIFRRNALMAETPHAKLAEILLIEGNPIDIRMTKEAFKDYRVASSVHVVTDGEAAMDFITSEARFKGLLGLI